MIAVFGYATKIPRFSIDFFLPQSLQQRSAVRKTFETVVPKLLKDFSFLITRNMFVENDGWTDPPSHPRMRRQRRRGRTEMKLGHQSKREGKREDLLGRNRRDKLPTNYNGRLVVVVLVVLLSVGRRRSAEEGTDGRRGAWCLIANARGEERGRTLSLSFILPLLSPQKRAPSLSPLFLSLHRLLSQPIFNSSSFLPLSLSLSLSLSSPLLFHCGRFPIFPAKPLLRY